MTRCSCCKVNYPDGLVVLMMVNGERPLVCGICALDISNEAHGITRKRFDGEFAEDLRQQAIEFRKRKSSAVEVET